MGLAVVLGLAAGAGLTPDELSFTGSLQTVNVFLPPVRTAATAAEASRWWAVMIAAIRDASGGCPSGICRRMANAPSGREIDSTPKLSLEGALARSAGEGDSFPRYPGSQTLLGDRRCEAPVRGAAFPTKRSFEDRVPKRSLGTRSAEEVSP